MRDDNLPPGCRVRDLEDDLHSGGDLDQAAEEAAQREDEAGERHNQKLMDES